MAIQLERTLLQGPDPRAVPERHLLRERRLRRRGGRPRSTSASPSAELTRRRGRAHRRPHPAPERHRPVRRPRAGARAPRRRARADGRAGYIDPTTSAAAAIAEPLHAGVRRGPGGRALPRRRTSSRRSSSGSSTTRASAPPPEDRRDLLFGGGLRIQTTSTSTLQAEAEQAVAAILPDADAHPTAALVSIEPATGYVRAMVGGRDFFGTAPTTSSTWPPGRRPPGRLVVQAVRAGRRARPGHRPSTRTYGAPAVLTIPLADGARPGRSLQLRRRPRRATSTLVEGTVRSYNTLYAQLIMDVGPAKARRHGRRGSASAARSQPYPPAVLGTNNVTALDMAAAYATFANRGVHVPPVAGHPDHPRRRHRRCTSASTPGRQGARRRRGRPGHVRSCSR